jgi:hypothetical protein
MVTRRKACIFKPKAYYALTISPSSQFFQVFLALQELWGSSMLPNTLNGS